MSNNLRLLVILPAAAAVVWLIPESSLKAPLLLAVLGAPLALGWVPRNWVYGMRTPRTLRGPESAWYMQNRITGVAMIVVGAVWLLIARR
jgi:hypothetical protein